MHTRRVAAIPLALCSAAALCACSATSLTQTSRPFTARPPHSQPHLRAGQPGSVASLQAAIKKLGSLVCAERCAVPAPTVTPSNPAAKPPNAGAKPANPVASLQAAIKKLRALVCPNGCAGAAP